MAKTLKKLVARYQRNKLAKERHHREKHNWEQAQLIVKSLEERGY